MPVSVVIEVMGGPMYQWQFPGTLTELELAWSVGAAPLHLGPHGRAEVSFHGTLQEISAIPDDMAVSAVVGQPEDTALYLADGTEILAPGSGDGEPLETAPVEIPEETFHPTLEARIWAQPRNKKHVLALADALEPHKRAELIRVQLAAETGGRDQTSKLLMLYGEELAGPYYSRDLSGPKITWKRGFIADLVLPANPGSDAIEGLFSSPVTRFLTGLTVHNADLALFLAQLDRAESTRLVRLHLPGTSPSAAQREQITQACPDLKELACVAWTGPLPSRVTHFRGHALPGDSTRLVDLETKTLKDANARTFWPNLKRLRVHMPADVDARQIETLGLDAACKLELVDGYLTDAAIQPLMRAVPKSKGVDVRSNRLSKYAVEDARSVWGKKVKVGGQQRAIRDDISPRDLMRARDMESLLTDWSVRLTQVAEDALTRGNRPQAGALPDVSSQPDQRTWATLFEKAVKKARKNWPRNTVDDENGRQVLDACAGACGVLLRANSNNELAFSGRCCTAAGTLEAWTLYPGRPVLPTSGSAERDRQLTELGVQLQP